MLINVQSTVKIYLLCFYFFPCEIKTFFFLLYSTFPQVRYSNLIYLFIYSLFYYFLKFVIIKINISGSHHIFIDLFKIYYDM
jgi:hypothetical protein